MKKYVIAAMAGLFMVSTAHAAEKIGASIALLEHNFLGIMAKGMQDYAAKNGVDLQIEDAHNDVAKQLGPDQQLHRLGR